jgi:uncharacterized protein
MRTHLPSRRRPVPARVLAATAAAAVLLAACGGDDDAALTDARPADDVPIEEGGETDANPLPDVPGVTEATPSDDIETSAAPSGDVATGSSAVPPLLEVIDGWPETTVTLADEVAITAKVAAEPAQRQQGLMNVEAMPDDVGMLFLFDDARTGGFWMKDTLIPLDIAYILDGEIVAILQMDPCEADPCPRYDPETEYDAALEVNQGVLADVGVDEGASVTWTDPVEVAAA